MIDKNKRIFILGAGRSGLMARGFAMRLVHIGYTVYVIGETITPSIQAGDVLVSVSGSGKTGSVLNPSKKAKETGAALISVTSDQHSPLGQIGDATIVVSVVRGESKEIAYKTAIACIKGGVKAIELTFTAPSADELIKQLNEEFSNDSEVIVGAGTVLDAITARVVIMAGAKFIVSPTFDRKTAFICNEYQIFLIYQDV